MIPLSRINVVSINLLQNKIGDSSLGCVQHHFCLLGPSTSHNGIASFCKHMCIKIRDGSLGKSIPEQYLHFELDLKINAKLNSNSSETVLKRYFERLMEEDIAGNEQTMSALEFD